MKKPQQTKQQQSRPPKNHNKTKKTNKNPQTNNNMTVFLLCQANWVRSAKGLTSIRNQRRGEENEISVLRITLISQGTSLSIWLGCRVASAVLTSGCCRMSPKSPLFLTSQRYLHSYPSPYTSTLSSPVVASLAVASRPTSLIIRRAVHLKLDRQKNYAQWGFSACIMKLRSSVHR